MKYPPHLRQPLIDDMFILGRHHGCDAIEYSTEFEIIQAIDCHRSLPDDHPFFRGRVRLLPHSHPNQRWCSTLYYDHDLNDENIHAAVRWAASQVLPVLRREQASAPLCETEQ